MGVSLTLVFLFADAFGGKEQAVFAQLVGGSVQDLSFEPHLVVEIGYHGFIGADLLPEVLPHGGVNIR